MCAWLLCGILCWGTTPRAAAASDTRWMLDAGHGGTDTGAVYGKRAEKDDNLRLTLAVGERLRAHGESVTYTRETDRTMELTERSQLCNAGSYTYFVSFHRNSASVTATGVETYTYTTATATSLSTQLAAKIQNALTDTPVSYADRGVKKANFHVLRETIPPAVLIEVGFLSNPADNDVFDRQFEAIADAIASACLAQVGKTFRPETTASSAATTMTTMPSTTITTTTTERQTSVSSFLPSQTAGETTRETTTASRSPSADASGMSTEASSAGITSPDTTVSLSADPTPADAQPKTPFLLDWLVAGLLVIGAAGAGCAFRLVRRRKQKMEKESSDSLR